MKEERFKLSIDYFNNQIESLKEKYDNSSKYIKQCIEAHYNPNIDEIKVLVKIGFMIKELTRISGNVNFFEDFNIFSDRISSLAKDAVQKLTENQVWRHNCTCVWTNAEHLAEAEAWHELLLFSRTILSYLDMRLTFAFINEMESKNKR